MLIRLIASSSLDRALFVFKGSSIVGAEVLRRSTRTRRHFIIQQFDLLSV